MRAESPSEREAVSDLAREDVRQAARKIRAKPGVPAVAIAPITQTPRGIDPLQLYRSLATELQLHALLFPTHDAGAAPVVWIVIARQEDVSPGELQTAVKRITG